MLLSLEDSVLSEEHEEFLEELEDGEFLEAEDDKELVVSLSSEVYEYKFVPPLKNSGSYSSS